MTNSPNPDPRSSQTLGFDEFIGIFVAFTTIGGILFWSFAQKNQSLNLTNILSPSPTPSVQPTLAPSPQVTVSPLPVFPVPTVNPTPSPTPIEQNIPNVVPIPTSTQPIKFVDVPDDFWARPFIDALAARGIISGFAGDYFRPNRPVTRAEFAAILQDAFEQNPRGSVTGFNDIPSNFWATPAINKATQVGFLKGYPGNIFRPQQEIPKAQVLVALVSGLNLATPSSPNQVLQVYQDAAEIPNYAREKIATATTNGLVVNYPDPNVLNPNRNATRAEVAATIYQALVQAGIAEPIASQYNVRVNP